MDKSADKLRCLEFNLNVGCSLGCYYCPQDKLIKSYVTHGTDKKKHLSFDEFKFVIDQRINPAGSIGFSGMSEPFENPEFVDMICYAYETGHPIILNTSLMGCTMEKLKAICSKVKSFERCQLHIPDMEGNSHFIIDDEYKNIVRKFVENYYSDIAFFSCHGTPNQDIFKLIDRFDIPVYSSDTFTSRAGNLDRSDVAHGNPKGDKIVCTAGVESQIHAPVIMPNGEMALCCNDYSPDWNIGNLFISSWGEISRGLGMKKYLDGLDMRKSSKCWVCAVAMERKAALKSRFPDWYIYGDNFLRIQNALEDNCVSIPVLEKIKHAKHICIYGLGKFFKDSYFASYWNTVLKADLLSDGNPELYGKTIMGIPIVAKENLRDYEQLLVVVYPKNDSTIKKDLMEVGVSNIVNISDIMEALDR